MLETISCVQSRPCGMSCITAQARPEQMRKTGHRRQMRETRKGPQAWRYFSSHMRAIQYRRARRRHRPRRRRAGAAWRVEEDDRRPGTGGGRPAPWRSARGKSCRSCRPCRAGDASIGVDAVTAPASACQALPSCRDAAKRSDRPHEPDFRTDRAERLCRARYRGGDDALVGGSGRRALVLYRAA